MAVSKYPSVSILDQIAKQIEDETGEIAHKASPSSDLIRFGFPEELMKPMRQQLAEATRTQGRTQRFDDHPSNEEQFTDVNKQLQLPTSSTIQQAAYWPKKQYLVVSFKSGHTYDYSNVDLKKMMMWEQASSAGSFFYYNIRMSYSYRKLG